MHLYKKQFLGLDAPLEKATVAILPVPYEGGISYGSGTSKGPDAIIDASHYLELYDEVLHVEPFSLGFATVEPLVIEKKPEHMIDAVCSATAELISNEKFVVVLGGDHSITTGYAMALKAHHRTFSVIQIDAHADLRERYDDSPFSHACVMSRIREITPHTLQIGIRSYSSGEAKKIEKEGIEICTMHDYRNRLFDINHALKKLPNPVFVTLDADALDWSVVASTGTPEPGGFLWDEIIALLHKIFAAKTIVGFDVVELVGNDADRNSPFAVAKLIYKMIGMKFLI